MIKNFIEKNFYSLIIFSFLLTLLLRLLNIEQKNLWFDEIFSWHLSQKSFVSIINGTAGDIHPPLFYLTLHIWTMIFGESVFAMRMLSVLFSLLTSFILFNLLRIFIDNKSFILLGMILFALSPLNIYYSHEVRMLNMNLFLCAASIFYFLRIRNSYSKRENIYYILFTSAAIYTHYFSFLILGTQFLILLYDFLKSKDKSILKTGVSFIAILILYIPWIFIMIRQIMRGQPWRTPQTFPELFKNTLAYFNDSFFSYYIYYQDIIPLRLIEFISIFILLVSIFAPIYFKFKLKNEKLFIVSLFFSIPFVISVIISFNNSILLSRYLSILVPFLIISLTAFTIHQKSYKKISLSILLITISVSGLIINYSYDFKNNDYRPVISYLDAKAEPDQLIVAEPHFMGWHLEHHAKISKSNFSIPETLGWSYEMILDSIQHKTELNEFWFLLDYSSLDTSSYFSIEESLSKLGYRKKYFEIFNIIPARIELYKFEKEF